MLRDGRAGSLGRITPVHKIRGLVESLNQRSRRLAHTAQPSTPSSLAVGQTDRQTVSHSTQSLAQYQSKRNITNCSVKRKRDGTSTENDESSFKPTKERNQEGTELDANCSLSSKKPKQVILSKLTESSSPKQSGGSQLFPVLKLKRTCESSNSYAVTVLNPQRGQLKEAHVTDKPEDPYETTSKASGSTKDNIVHSHNTRYKARKGTENWQMSFGSGIEVNEINHPASSQDEDSTVKIITEGNSDIIPADVNAEIQFKEGSNTNSKVNKNVLLQTSSKSKRKLKPKKVFHSQNMRVGDIVWGKVHGHPWWPGRVLGILCNASESDGGCQVVKVSWYGSTTTSDISCSSLLTFQEHFNHLFKKQKKGAYRLAVRQARKDLEVCNNGTQVMPA